MGTKRPVLLLAVMCLLPMLGACGGQRYYRWNFREQAVGAGGGTLLDRDTATAQAARGSSGGEDPEIRTTPLESGDYVRVSVERLCFPDDPDRVLGTMFNPEAARMSFIFFATNDQNADILRDVESMTGPQGAAARERLRDSYRVVPSLNYTSRGGCVNRRFSTGWIPVDDAESMPRVAFTAMVLHQEEFDRVTGDVGRLMAIADDISSSETAVVTNALRAVMDTTGEVLAVTNPNRHVLWFEEALERLVVTGSDGRPAVITSPYLVLFAEPQATDDEGARSLLSDGERVTSQSQLNNLIAQRRLTYSAGRIRMEGAPDGQYPEPYAEVRIEVRDRVSMGAFWERLNEVLVELARGSSFNAQQVQTLGGKLYELQNDFNLAHQTGNGVQNAGMRVLTRQHAQELRDWLAFTMSTLHAPEPNCSTYETAMRMRLQSGERVPAQTLQNLQSYLDVIKGRPGMGECPGVRLLNACVAATHLSSPGVGATGSGDFTNRSPLDVRNDDVRPDQLFAVDVPRAGNLLVTVGADPGMVPLVGIVRGCSDDWVVREAQRLDDPDRGNQWATALTTVQQPGRYYVVVENGNPGRGVQTPQFNIAYDLLPPSAGLVAAMTNVQRRTTARVEVDAQPVGGRVNLYRAAPVGTGFCDLRPYQLRDQQVFLMDVGEAGDYRVSLTGEGRGFNGVLSLWRRDANGNMVQVGTCGTAAVEAHLEPDQYVVAVNAVLPSSTGQSQFQLSVRRSDGDDDESVNPRPVTGCNGLAALPINQRQVVSFDASASRGTSAMCGNTGEGPEESVVVEVTEPGRYIFAATEVGGGADPLLYLRDGCEPTASERICNDDADNDVRREWGEPLSQFGSGFAADLQPGRYVLVVDTYRQTAGQVAVQWRRAGGQVVPPPPAPAPAAVCGAATPLPVGQLTRVTLPSREGAITPVGCGDSSGIGAEQAFTVQVTEPGEYVFVADGAGGADPVLHLRSSCMDDRTQLVCNDDMGEGLRQQHGLDVAWNAAAFQARLEPGTYTLLADTYGLNGGDLTVGWRRVGGGQGGGGGGGGAGGGGGGGGGSDANAAAVCGNAPDLPAGTARTLTLPSGAGNVMPVSCGLEAAGQGSEHAFTIRVRRAGSYLFQSRGSGGADTVLYLRRACTDRPSQLVCNDDAPQDLRPSVPNLDSLGSAFQLDLQPGEYALIVDTYSTNGGAVEVQWGPAP